jgi:flagellar hook assembly protein FlgD
VSPNPFSPDGDGEEDVLHVLLHAELAGLRVQAEIRDLLGATVVELGNDKSGGNLRQWIWDGRTSRGRRVPMGAYVVVVQSEGNGAAPRRWTALVALGRQP